MPETRLPHEGRHATNTVLPDGSIIVGSTSLRGVPSDSMTTTDACSSPGSRRATNWRSPRHIGLEIEPRGSRSVILWTIFVVPANGSVRRKTARLRQRSTALWGCCRHPLATGTDPRSYDQITSRYRLTGPRSDISPPISLPPAGQPRPSEYPHHDRLPPTKLTVDDQ